LILLHVKDFQINLQGEKMVQFADNTNIQIKATNEDILNQQINRVMQQLLIWFHVNGLVINTKNQSNVIPHLAQ
jgi:hypothetical protein